MNILEKQEEQRKELEKENMFKKVFVFPVAFKELDTFEFIERIKKLERLKNV